MHIMNAHIEVSSIAPSLMGGRRERPTPKAHHGEKRAAYGKHIIEIASKAITEKFGQGFSETTLRAYRKFYLEFPLLQIQRALPAEFNSKIEAIQRPLLAEFQLTDKDAGGQPLLPQLSWMHYERLMRITDKEARLWYMGESAREQWDYRTLRRNIDSQYYYRLLQTPTDSRQEVVDEMKSLTASMPSKEELRREIERQKEIYRLQMGEERED